VIAELTHHGTFLRRPLSATMVSPRASIATKVAIFLARPAGARTNCC
jgi:hypothetical protein